jgi:hypothetical protein
MLPGSTSQSRLALPASGTIRSMILSFLIIRRNTASNDAMNDGNTAAGAQSALACGTLGKIPLPVTKVTENSKSGSVTKVTDFLINYFDGGSDIKILEKLVTFVTTTTTATVVRRPRPCWRLVEKAVTFVTFVTTDTRVGGHGVPAVHRRGSFGARLAAIRGSSRPCCRG